MLPKGQALTFAFSILGQVRNLFSSTEELEQAVLLAQSESGALPDGGRPVVQ
jgi:hypothetical protein